MKMIVAEFQLQVNSQNNFRVVFTLVSKDYTWNVLKEIVKQDFQCNEVEISELLKQEVNVEKRNL